MAQPIAPTDGYHSLKALGFDGFEHTLPATSGNRLRTMWLRKVGEPAIEVEVNRSVLDTIERFARPENQRAA